MEMTIEQKNFLTLDVEPKELKKINQEFLYLYNMMITNRVDPSEFPMFTELQSFLSAAESNLSSGWTNSSEEE